MSDILLHLLPPIASSLLYAVLGFHFWRTRWRETDKPLAALPMQLWERGAIAAVLVLQGIGIYDGLFGAGGMRFSFAYALSLMLWLAVFIYWLESFHSRMDGLQPMVLPVAAACALLPALFPQMHPVAHAGAWGFRLHFLAAMLAYSLFTLSALHAVFMGFAERKLHRRALSKSLASLPPILTMEAVLFRMIVIAFALLTLALGSGVLFSEAIFGRAMALDHKTLFAFVSWGIFAALLVGRHAYGWRGRIALRWTLAGFMVLLLAYVGSRFVVEVILGRPS
ncbi:MAG: cytochrome c biogenesis protein CcsA [Betaproteobacteria bacterium]|nr:cytochrome c biogenesis protein CcsA [Betaproteobacteria bacterium]